MPRVQSRDGFELARYEVIVDAKNPGPDTPPDVLAALELEADLTGPRQYVILVDGDNLVHRLELHQDVAGPTGQVWDYRRWGQPIDLQEPASDTVVTWADYTGAD